MGEGTWGLGACAQDITFNIVFRHLYQRQSAQNHFSSAARTGGLGASPQGITLNIVLDTNIQHIRSENITYIIIIYLNRAARVGGLGAGPQLKRICTFASLFLPEISN